MLLCSTIESRPPAQLLVLWEECFVSSLGKRIVVSTETNQDLGRASVEKPGTRKVSPQVCKFNNSASNFQMTLNQESRQKSLHKQQCLVKCDLPYCLDVSMQAGTCQGS